MDQEESKLQDISTNNTLKDGTVGERIKNKRKGLKITQKQLAKRIHKAESSIQKYESGAVEIPNRVLQVIAEELGTTAHYLLGYDDIRKEYDEIQLFKNQLKLLNCEYEFVDGIMTDSYMHEKEGYFEEGYECGYNKEEGTKSQYYEVTYNSSTTRIPAVDFENFKEESNAYLKFKLQELLKKFH